MRILLCVHQFFPSFTLGTERYALGLARAFQKSGHEVLIFTTESNAGNAGLLIEYEYEGIPVRAINLAASPPRRFRDYHSRSDFQVLHRRVIIEFKPDIVHICHLLGLGMELVNACVELGVPRVMTFTDLWSICWAGQCIKPCDSSLCKGPDANGLNCAVDLMRSQNSKKDGFALEKAIVKVPIERVQRLITSIAMGLPPELAARVAPDIYDASTRNSQIRETLKNLDHAFFPSAYLKDACLNSGLPVAVATVLNYGIRLPDAEERALLRSPRPAGPPVFGFTGQLSKHKGLHIILQAFCEAAIPGAKLHIYGKYNPGDKDAPYLKKLIESTPGASHEGYYQGEEVYRKLHHFDVLVIPSLWHENAPLVMLEALAAGKPLIISNGKGMVEFVKEDSTALIAKLGCKDSLKHALCRFADNGFSLPGISAEKPGYGFAPEAHAEILMGKYYPSLARPFNEAKVAAGSGLFDLGNYTSLSSLRALPASLDLSSFILQLAQTRLKGCELRVPGPASTTAGEETGEDLSELEDGEGRYRHGKTFPKLNKKHLYLRTHTKPYASIWGMKTRRIELSRIDGFEQMASIEITARAKHGRKSLLSFTGYRVDDTERKELIERSWSWNWSPKTWTNVVIDLKAIREAGMVPVGLIWNPVETSDKWKIDVLKFKTAG